ncbi:fumarylacetoacetate hydrolase [Lampropedia aestuarii]|uniref:Fumarylacetoacetate hydrolase n=1 Tax=Lampropedia aestuarii TaxID=2562762 RepID=A0A4S5BWS8_9BURK|nr:fumarylacetoacetate hydrolase family protein [Lampropedia aestuarii]MDH5855990.1 fumarylacetoacetate hydrolase family protein [Lampropedia aestuarii]THJ35681.1 fumarylacetoacetate hydrolase [Lampropedia aestuarii]
MSETNIDNKAASNQAAQRRLTAAEILPTDWQRAQLAGRVWRNDVNGPVPVLVLGGVVYDASAVEWTLSALLEREDLLAICASRANLQDIGSVDDYLSGAKGRLLAPADLQSIKAAGVTFADSMLERVIEEQAKGDPQRAQAIRERLAPVLGDSLRGVEAGSEKAAEVKRLLQDMGLWSQYLEVGIGPDAEIFTKSQPMSAVGCGEQIGIHPNSQWNNPEPEVVLAVNSRGRIIGMTLGNDVNLRDIEGRSALLLGKAKDNNASCAIGPFIRLLDGHFGLEQVASLEVSLLVEGTDGFEMQGVSPMAAISRSPENLVGQLLNRNHQYPDGVLFFLGTMFAPVKDRHGPGLGFTHAIDDRVVIATPTVGALVNWVARTDVCPPWEYGLGDLFAHLLQRAKTAQAA